MDAVFVPGSGREGRAAWTALADAVDDAGVRTTFLDRADALVASAVVVEALGTSGAHLVAHSAGAVTATAVAAAHPDLVRSLVLFEPACFGLVRGGPHVEQHVAQMSPVYAAADDLGVGDGEFATRFLTALGAPRPFPGEPALSALGGGLRRTPPPWEVVVDPAVVTRVPTLVVTGAWNDLYDEVAGGLVRAGAAHAVLAGHQHRPQDHKRAWSVVRDHWERVTA